MEKFKEKLRSMEHELEGAMSYAKMASCYASYDPQSATTFSQMSADEMKHATNLKTMAETELKKHIDTKSEHTEAMQVLYDFEVEKFADMSAEINGYIASMKR